jgi:hypothetical protein
MSTAATISIATPEHGPAIAELIGATTWKGIEHVDWTNLGGQWLVALHDDKVAGCIQVLPGLPIGRLEHMGLAKWLNRRQRATIVSMFMDHGQATLMLAGCQLCMGLVPDELSAYRAAWERRGAIAVSSDNWMLIKRLG